jgi:hypothetical protein
MLPVDGTCLDIMTNCMHSNAQGSMFIEPSVYIRPELHTDYSRDQRCRSELGNSLPKLEPIAIATSCILNSRTRTFRQIAPESSKHTCEDSGEANKDNEQASMHSNNSQPHKPNLPRLRSWSQYRKLQSPVQLRPHSDPLVFVEAETLPREVKSISPNQRRVIATKELSVVSSKQNVVCKPSPPCGNNHIVAAEFQQQQ